MTEEASEMVEGLHAQEVSLAKIMKMESLNMERVHLYQATLEDFYDWLARIHQRRETPILAGSIATCVGGLFRSSRLNEEFSLMKVETPLEFGETQRNKGLTMDTVAQKIMHGEVAKDGTLVPEGFNKPLDTLFVALDTDLASTEPANLYMLMRAIKSKELRTGKSINLNLIAIPCDENELGQRGRKFEDEVLGLNQE